MEQRGISCSGSGPLRLIKKPERKVTEKNRRNQMKFLYSHLFSLVPPHLISKGGDQVPDRVDRTIEYIQSLNASLEMSNNKKEKLLSIRKKRSYVTVCNPLDIQIHQISHDLDAVLVTGLTSHSNFLDVVRLLDQYSAEVVLASFSSCGHSTFHVHHKKIESEEMCERIKILLGGSSISKTKNGNDLGDNYASSHSHRHNQSDSTDLSLSVWDFDFQSNVWGWELEAFSNGITG